MSHTDMSHASVLFWVLNFIMMTNIRPEAIVLSFFLLQDSEKICSDY